MSVQIPSTWQVNQTYHLIWMFAYVSHVRLPR